MIAGIAKGDRRAINFTSSDASVTITGTDDGLNEKVTVDLTGAGGAGASLWAKPATDLHPTVNPDSFTVTTTTGFLTLAGNQVSISSSAAHITETAAQQINLISGTAGSWAAGTTITLNPTTHLVFTPGGSFLVTAAGLIDIESSDNIQIIGTGIGNRILLQSKGNIELTALTANTDILINAPRKAGMYGITVEVLGTSGTLADFGASNGPARLRADNGDLVLRSKNSAFKTYVQAEGDVEITPASAGGTHYILVDNLPTSDPAVTNALFTTRGHVYKSPATPLGYGKSTRSTTQAISSSTAWTTISFDTEVTDSGAFVDIAGNPTRITVPATGVYLVGFEVAFAVAAGGLRDARIQATGTGSGIVCRANDDPAGGSFEVALGQSTLWNLTAADYIELQVRQNSGGSVNINANNPTDPVLWCYGPL